MSGVLRFLQGIWGPKEVEENKDDNASSSLQQQDTSTASVNQQDKDTKQFSWSLSSTASFDMLPGTPSRRSQGRLNTIQEEEEKETPRLTHKRWKKHQQEILTNFINKRFTKSDDSSDEENDNDEMEEEETAGETQETAALASQQFKSHQQQVQDEEELPVAARRNKKKVVPHIDEALHNVSTVSGIDLYTQTLNLDLCQVEVVHEKRDVKRHAGSAYGGQHSPPSNGDQHPLPMYPYAFTVEDGPLGCIYKQVLSAEVTQLQDPTSTQVRQAATAAFPDQKLYRRIRIFFYGRYAQMLDTFLRIPHVEKLVLSLKDVPARCIFPYVRDESSWWTDCDIANHCICIGDSSMMRIKDDDVNVNMRFDDERLQVSLLRFEHNKKKNVPLEDLSVQQVGLSATNVGEASLPLQRLCDLKERYETWLELHREEEQQKRHAEQQQKQRAAAAATPAQQSQRQEQQAAPAAAPAPPTPPREQEATGRGSGVRQRDAETSTNARERSRKRSRRTTNLKYHTLNELEAFEAAHSDSSYASTNVCGVVLGFGVPTFTKRRTYCLSFSIVDETLPLPALETTEEGKETTEEGKDDDVPLAIPVVMFANTLEQLPKLLMAGDVVRLRCVHIQYYQGNVQILATDRRGSSAIVVRSTGENQWENFPTSAAHATLEDPERCKELWRWGQERLMSHPTMKVATSFKLSDLGRSSTPGEQEDNHQSADATIMVTSMFEVPRGNGQNQPLPFGYIRVWDGTGPPVADSLPLATREANACALHGEPEPSGMSRLAKAIHSLNETDSDDETDEGDVLLEPPKSLCGKIVNLAVWEQPHWELAKKALYAGRFIRLRNVQEGALYSGLRCVMLNSKSWMTPLPDRTYEIKALLEEHSTRIAKNEAFNPQSGVLPLDGDTFPDASLPQTPAAAAAAPLQQSPVPIPSGDSISQCINEPAPKTFNVKFQIKKTIPEVRDIKSLCEGSGRDRKYQFVASLSDDSGEIGAVVTNEVGQTAFGMTADEAYNTPDDEGKEMIEFITRENAWWCGQVQSVDMKGTKFFVLESIEISSQDV